MWKSWAGLVRNGGNYSRYAGVNIGGFQQADEAFARRVVGA